MFKPTHALWLILLMVSGCVTTSPEQLFTPVTAPAGQAQNTGQFTIIGEQKQGETRQLTPIEVEAEKQKVAKSAQRAAPQAAQNSEAAYKAEIQALQKLANDQKQRRLREIESREF